MPKGLHENLERPVHQMLSVPVDIETRDAITNIMKLEAIDAAEVVRRAISVLSTYVTNGHSGPQLTSIDPEVLKVLVSEAQTEARR
ncbi:MAG TPA: hypothetical protein VLG37_03150 [Candidatus Saccharimonadales bacterium]|nr:hypothetical protein [Candidatus Saccharimonadales bacterium]